MKPETGPDVTPDLAAKVRRKQQHNALAKLQAGKTLTVREEKLLTEPAPPVSPGEVGTAAPRGPSEPAWVSSYEKLGKIVGLHCKSFPRLIKDHHDQPDLPGPNQRGEHSVPAWRAFILNHGIDARSLESSAGKSGRELELLEEKIRKARFENELREGQYLPVAEAANFLRDSHESLKRLDTQIHENEMPPLLAGKTAPAIRVANRAANDRKAALMREQAGAFARLAGVKPEGDAPKKGAKGAKAAKTGGTPSLKPAPQVSLRPSGPS